MVKRLFAVFFVSFMLGAPGLVGAAVPPPQATLKASVDQLQQLIAQHHKEYEADSRKFYAVVNQLVVPRFDVPYVAQLVMGVYWRQATPRQRQDFQNAFKDMLIRSYANSLLENASTTTVEWLPSRYQEGSKTATVKTLLVGNTGQKYPIDFAVRLVGGDWKIYDIIVDNISLVLNFRTQIAGELKQNGIDAVIAKFRTEELPVGTPEALTTAKP